jgi:hypothetical protein
MRYSTEQYAAAFFEQHVQRMNRRKRSARTSLRLILNGMCQRGGIDSLGLPECVETAAHSLPVFVVIQAEWMHVVIRCPVVCITHGLQRHV